MPFREVPMVETKEIVRLWLGGVPKYSIEDARSCARAWCLAEYGMRRHTRTQRLPLEHFEAEEKPRLLPAPSEPYDPPLWCTPKVGRDQLAAVDKALYSLPAGFRGKKLDARADRHLVRFYDHWRLVKTHPRQPPGGRSIDRSDFPAEKTAYAMRDVEHRTLRLRGTARYELAPTYGNANRCSKANCSKYVRDDSMRTSYLATREVRRDGQHNPTSTPTPPLQRVNSISTSPPSATTRLL
jgi:hypothetical protein